MKEEIMSYFQTLDRSFYMEQHKDKAEINSAFPIGHGQTISQPTLVRDMTLALDLHPKHRVLEIGTGSGFQTDLLASFAEEVYTIERIPELHERAKQKLTEKGFTNIQFRLGNGAAGWPEAAPFDRMMVTAAGTSIPPALLEQLKEGGKMVIPVGDADFQKLMLVHKQENGEIETTLLAHVRFVRLEEE